MPYSFRILYHKPAEKSTFRVGFGDRDVDVLPGRGLLRLPDLSPLGEGAESRHSNSGLFPLLLDVGNLDFQLDIPPVRQIKSRWIVA